MLSRTSIVLLSFACLWVGCRSNVEIFGPIGSTGSGAQSGAALVGGSSSVAETVGSTATTSGGGSASVCGDGQCDGGETPRNCPEDCEQTSTCEHAVCEVGEALEAECESCVTKVCAEDGYCCNNWWDDTCIGLADELCGAGCCGNGMCEGQTCASCPDDCGGVCVCGDGNCEGENCSDCAEDCGPCPSCGHTACVAGSALSLSECRPACVKDVCLKDPNCCQTGWTLECTALAASLCSGPDPCVEKVCAKDATCCMSGWGTSCVELAKVACATECDCPHGLCDTGNVLNEKCDPCVASICAADPYCCQNDWDGVCVDEVGTICGIVCN